MSKIGELIYRHSFQIPVKSRPISLKSHPGQFLWFNTAMTTLTAYEFYCYLFCKFQSSVTRLNDFHGNLGMWWHRRLLKRWLHSLYLSIQRPMSSCLTCHPVNWYEGLWMVPSEPGSAWPRQGSSNGCHSGTWASHRMDLQSSHIYSTEESVKWIVTKGVYSAIYCCHNVYEERRNGCCCLGKRSNLRSCPPL